MNQARNYDLIEKVGEGTFGAVYRAHQPSINREVAIKVIHPHYANDPEFIKRFHTEAEIIGRLEHPHIVPLYDYWQDDSGAYLVMRWMRGGDLKNYLSRKVPAVSMEIARQWLQQLTHALYEVHRTGIVHRDIKPANILLDENLNAYLADFGISKQNTLALHDQTKNLFTPVYAAPEQFRSEAITPATDIYCLGIVLFEILTQKSPFTGSLAELLKAHLYHALPSLTQYHLNLPPNMDQVLAKATAKNPEDRFLSAKEFWEAFRGVLDRDVKPIQPTTVANPFFHRGPISDTAFFFGQQSELHQLENFIQTGQSASIIGQRRSGKTSLLFAAMRSAQLKRQQPDERLLVFIDCGSLVTLSELEIYRTLIEEIADKLITNGIEDVALLQMKDSELSYRDFDRSLKVLFRSCKQLCLLLDEFEHLSLNPNLSNNFFTGLRALAMRYPLLYITASRLPLIDLTYADNSTLSSPFFNIFTSIQLGLFNDLEARQLLLGLSTHGGYAFDNEIIDRVSAYCGGQPLFLQIAGYQAFNLLTTTGKIDWKDFYRLFYQDVAAHLEYYWRSLTVAQQSVLARLPVVADEDQVLLLSLERDSLIVVAPDGKYKPFSPIFTRFIRSQAIPEIKQVKNLVVDLNRRLVILDGWLIDLTPTQFTLLNVLIHNPGEILSLEAIEMAVWGDEPIDNPERLKSAIKGLRRALGDHGAHLDNVRGVGYRWKQNI